jgi:branched-chain amino acid transport system substrate-binding protein
MIQFQGVKDKNIDQFRGPGRQVIIAPAKLQTGQVQPFDKLRK